MEQARTGRYNFITEEDGGAARSPAPAHACLWEWRAEANTLTCRPHSPQLRGHLQAGPRPGLLSVAAHGCAGSWKGTPCSATPPPASPSWSPE